MGERERLLSGKRFRHENFVTYSFIFLLLGGGIALLYFFGSHLTGFAVFSQTGQGDFDLGTYVNTSWNGSSVVLYGNNLTGSYTSPVFDAGADSIWNNLSYESGSPDVEFLFGVDVQADLWSSGDGGVTWNLVKDDYNEGDGNGATDLEKNSTHLILLYNQDLWISSNLGVSWTKINDDYNGGEGQNGDVLGIDLNNYIYIIEGDQDVWRSVDGGISFSKMIANFNGGNGVVLGLVVNNTGAIFSVDVHADVWVSLDQGVTWVLVKDDFNGAIGNNVDDLTIDSNDNLYIVDRQDFWKSTDNGVTWTLVDDDINDAGDSNDGLVAYVDQNNNIYIIDGSEDILKSTDGGTTFTKVNSTDFNGGNGNVFGLNSFSNSTNISFLVMNCSLSNCGDGVWQSADPSNINLQGQYFQYNVNLVTPYSGRTPFLSSVSIDYSLINQPPVISLALPQEGDSYGNNESISLNFSVNDSDGNLQSCWYNIDGGTNISISGCANTSFDVSGSGSFTFNIYANDTLGEIATDSASFSVQLGAPSISITYPFDVFLSSGSNIQFSYTPSDIDLESCQLWGNFTGVWTANQTDSSPISGSQNIFSLYLSDDLYKWNIWCNDSLGNSAFNGNKTFVVDSTKPNIALTEPSGTKTSRNSLPLVFSVVDANIASCWYNIYRGEAIEVSNTSINCSSGSGNFNVTVDADFVLNFYANDSSGNLNFSSTNFVVDTSTSPVVGGGGSSGGSGGGGVFISRPDMEVGSISDIVLSQGGTKKVASWRVKNNGTVFLNECLFSSRGEYSSWIPKTETKGLASGEEHVFVFDVNVPENLSEGGYILEMMADCNELNRTESFIVDITGRQIGFELINVERIDEKSVGVSYIISELVGRNQSVEMQFLIFDLENKKEAEVNEIKFISASSQNEFETIVPIREGLEGELSLLVNLNSESYSAFVQENIVLGSRATGFSVFGEEGTKDSFVSVLIVVLFVVFAFFIVRRIRRHKHTIKESAYKKRARS